MSWGCSPLRPDWVWRAGFQVHASGWFAEGFSSSSRGPSTGLLTAGLSTEQWWERERQRKGGGEGEREKQREREGEVWEKEPKTEAAVPFLTLNGWPSLFFFSPFLIICLFIYLWLCWVFVSVRGLSPVVATGGHSSSRYTGLSPWRPLPLQSTGSRRAGSVIVAHGPSRSAACGIFPDQGSNPCPLHWQADSQPLRHQGSPGPHFWSLLWVTQTNLDAILQRRGLQRWEPQN